MRTYVVDQNMMRKPALAALVANEPNSSFIVPDVGLVEMSKSGNWEGTMRPSLAVFAKATNRTHISLSVGEAIDRELNLFVPITSKELLNADLTSFGRSLINELSSGVAAASMELIRVRFSVAFTHLQRLDLNAASAKARITDLAHRFKTDLKSEVIKALRSNNFRQYKLALITAHSEQILRDHVLPKEMAPAQVYKFISQQSLTFRYAVLLTRHALDWAIKDGLDALPAERELNHLLDIEYAVIASYFDGLITEDSGARAAYSDLTEILAMSPNMVTETMQRAIDTLFPRK